MTLFMICHGLLATNHAQQSKDVQETQLPCAKKLITANDDLQKKKMELKHLKVTSASLRRQLDTLRNEKNDYSPNLEPLQQQITEESMERIRWKGKANEIKRTNIHQKEQLQSMLSKFQTNALAAYDDAQKATSDTFGGLLNELKSMASPNADPAQDTLEGDGWQSMPIAGQAPTGEQAPAVEQGLDMEQLGMVPKMMPEEVQPEAQEEQDLPVEMMAPEIVQGESHPDVHEKQQDLPVPMPAETLPAMPDMVPTGEHDEQPVQSDMATTDEMLEENAPIDLN